MRSDNLARDMDDESRSAESGVPGEGSAEVEAQPGPVVINYDRDLDDRHCFSPAVVRVRAGETLAFQANGTKAVIFFPQAATMFGNENEQVLGVGDGGAVITPEFQKGAVRDEVYEYAIFCEAAGRGGKGKSLGRFAEGSSTPKVIIEPPGDN